MSEATPAGARFHEAPRQAIRQVPWWDRLGYIQRRLPEALGAAITALELNAGDRVLDFGCADQPYRRLLPDGIEYLGADLPGNAEASVEIQPDGRLPLPDAHVDAVLSTQVLEHVADPAVYLDECRRVLRPGGQLLLSTHGIMLYHPDPVDYWRWTHAGLRKQIEQSGLAVETMTGVMGLTATGLQLFQDGLFARTPQRLRGLLTRVMQTLIAYFDKRESERSLSLNALVFIASARRAQEEDA